MPHTTTRLIQYDRLTAPNEHLGVLIEPAAPRLYAAFDTHRRRTWNDVRVLDTTVGAVRATLRDQVGLRGPVIASGHQAEFFHAGVFAKLIAADALASQYDGQAVFLTVDSDPPRQDHIVLPQITSNGLRRIDVELPACDLLRPYEMQPVMPREHWLQFFARTAAMHDYYDRSLLPAFARGWLAVSERSVDYCDALAGGHAAACTALGLAPLHEIRLSKLCQTSAWRTFVAQMLLTAREMAAGYNAAQADYRQQHRVRTAGRPVPPLRVSPEWTELPLWAIGPDEPRRRLYVREGDGTIELRTDHDELGTWTRTALRQAANHADPWPLERKGWSLRPRALVLSAFVRLYLADLFIHGIGGAKYDELTEAWINRWLGIEPMPLACVSATVRLPLPYDRVTLDELRNARRASRDLRYNPQRHLKNPPKELVQRRIKLARKSDELAANKPKDHTAREEVFREIRRVSAEILATDPWCVARYDQRVESLERRWELAQVALDREYFYALHTQTALVELVEHVRAALHLPKYRPNEPVRGSAGG